MSNAPLILVTRPDADDGEFSQALMAEGYKIFHEPMLEIVPEVIPANLPSYDGLIFTGQHAVRIFSAKIADRKTPVYAVGPQTRDELISQRFEKVVTAMGGLADLNEILMEEPISGGGTLLYVRGRDTSGEIIAPPGFQIEELVVYRAEKASALSDSCRKLIENGEIGAATFFSVRTAEAFLSLVRQNRIESSLSAIKALCISQSVLECVRLAAWSESRAAKTPDRQGMTALVRETLPEPNPKQEAKLTAMSTPTDQDSIRDAEKIIERFGGIRPMASKINVPVTTVQGWKKRNVIPATRREEILAAARIHNINLSDLLGEEGGPANQNSPSQNDELTEQSEKSPAPARQSVPSASGFSAANTPGFEEKLARTKTSAVKQSTAINTVIILLTVGAVIALLWPQTQENGERIGALETEVGEVKEEQSFFRSLIPQDFARQLGELKEQALQARETIKSSLETAQVISDDVLAEDAGTLEDRIERLEAHVGEIGSPQMQMLLARVDAWQQSAPGQQKLSGTISELNGLLAGLGGQTEEGLNQALESARGQSQNLNETFEGVPSQDMKAAALLLGLTQFRSSLNRDKQPFDQDLQLLMKLVGEENPELTDSLTRLAPQAEKGVLTPGGLSNEFKTMAGDIVVSSLKGEDVSIQEKARARMNELFAIEKNGELVTGTDTQAKVVRTQKMIDEGNIEGAIAELQTLDGEAAVAAQPFLEEAQMTLIAEKVKQLLSQTINMRAYGKGGITAKGLNVDGLIPSDAKLIQDETTGINILKTSPMEQRFRNPPGSARPGY